MWGQESCLSFAHHGTRSSERKVWSIASHSVICWIFVEWINVNFLPTPHQKKKTLQELPFQTWTHVHSSAWYSSICTTTSLFSFSLMHLNSLSDKNSLYLLCLHQILPEAWVFPPPGSFPVPTVQVFLELLLSITHFVLNDFPNSFIPHLTSS